MYVLDFVYPFSWVSRFLAIMNNATKNISIQEFKSLFSILLVGI